MQGHPNIWDKIYESPDGWYPNEFVVRFLAKYIKKRTGLTSYHLRRPDVKRVMDLGCGSGRHVIMLAGEGYETAGIDSSLNAISFAHCWLEHEGLKADLKVGTAQNLPWADDFFDVVIAHGVLDHMTRNDALQALRELNRVLRAKGLLYLSLASTDEYSFGKGEAIDPFTFRLTEGDEAGLIQRFFTIDQIFAFLETRFIVLDIVYDCWRPYYGKGFSALDIDNLHNLKY